MANVDHTGNINYGGLSAGAKAAVDAAVTAIRAAFTASKAEDGKNNVRTILREVTKNQEET